MSLSISKKKRELSALYVVKQTSSTNSLHEVRIVSGVVCSPELNVVPSSDIVGRLDCQKEYLERGRGRIQTNVRFLYYTPF